MAPLDSLRCFHAPSIFTSPAAHLIDLDRPLSKQETAAIADAAAQAAQHLAFYTKSIAEISTELQRLVAEQDALCQLRERHLAVIAPIRRCLPELLSQIFIKCLPTSTNHNDNWKTPVVISHVSRHWRDVAVYMTPQLWSQLFIPWCRSNSGKTRIKQEQVASWMQRSRNSPISIAVAVGECRYPQDHGADEFDGIETAHPHESFTQVLGYAAKFSHRWQSASFDLILREHGPDAIPNCCFPLLKSLKYRSLYSTLSSSNQPGLQNESSIICAFESAPRLESVYWTHSGHGDKVILPWPQIMHLATDTPQFLQYLSQMQNLVTYNCYRLAGLNHDSATLVNVIHHNLRTLYLQPGHHMGTMCFFRHLTLPGLAHLCLDGGHVSGEESDWTSVRGSFTDFLSRSSYSLHTLCLLDIHTFITNSDDCFQILILLPTLVNLHFGRSKCGDKNQLVVTVLEVLTATQPVAHANGRDQPICPALQNIKLYGWIPTQVIPTLGELICSREREGGSDNDVEAIEKVSFSVPFETRYTTMCQLRALQDVFHASVNVHIDVWKRGFDMAPVTSGS